MKKLDELTDEELSILIDRSIDMDVTDSVRDIMRDVDQRGDKALTDYTQRFDDKSIDEIRVDINKDALNRIPEQVLKGLEASRDNIQSYHEKQLRENWNETITDGVERGRLHRPVDRAGVYIPGGGAAYPSTALMTVIPAKTAGVDEIAACTPPPISDATTAALAIAGVDEVYQIGGAQAIAALTYGTESVPSVDVIVGPGNQYVTAAKIEAQRHGKRIEFPAGPSEIGVIADSSADPWFIALDMAAQLEHGPDTQAVLVTDSEDLGLRVENRIAELLRESNAVGSASDRNWDVIHCEDLYSGMEFMERYAPEHLSIVTRDENAVLDRVKSAGSVFIGEYTPVAAGDYATGTNHVLPTSGFASVYGGLGVKDFIREVSVQSLTRDGLEDLAPIITSLAETEGLDIHARSVYERLDE